MAPISVTLAPRDPPAAVVALVGEHDAYSAGRLEGELTVLADEGRHVVVDLRDAEFIDSSTLGVLLNAGRDAEHAGLGFTIVLASRAYTQVNQLLDLTGLGSAFAIYDTLDTGLAAARRGESGGSVRSAA
jgi:anti-anti-sigma factor